MRIQRIQCGNANCYLVENKGEAVLVDTAQEKYRDKILEACRNVKIQLIVLTHPHIDHAQNAAYFAETWNVPIAMGKEDEALIEDNLHQPLFAKKGLGKLVLSFSMNVFRNGNMPKFTPAVFLKEGDDLSEYGIPATVLSLAGHTNGSIGLDIEEKAVIVGDALMNFGRPSVSLLYHDEEQMLKSAEKITSLGERMIYFGHGKPVKNQIWRK